MVGEPRPDKGGPKTLEKDNYKEKYEQSIERYKAALLEYKEWLQENSHEGNILPEKERESLLKHTFIDGMAEALGLSQEDEIKFMNEIGWFKKGYKIKDQEIK